MHLKARCGDVRYCALGRYIIVVMNGKCIVTLLAIALLMFAQPALARSGCCSHHDGVMSNGCGCNDGTPLSDKCAPYYTCSAGSVETAPVQIALPTAIPYVAPTAIPTPIPTRVIVRTPTSTPSPTPTAVPTVKPTRTPSATPIPMNDVAMPAPKSTHSGFWGFFLSLFGMSDR